LTPWYLEELDNLGDDVIARPQSVWQNKTELSDKELEVMPESRNISVSPPIQKFVMTKKNTK